ncbi:ATPase family AAA domain-containing protein 2-like, partial [Bombina bombina]|uniref:ATPase family AAA domain-containing protein 2-like n=1 Tax=Bombina bombina TaxID=8345 RepID=UPI00235A480D
MSCPWRLPQSAPSASRPISLPKSIFSEADCIDIERLVLSKRGFSERVIDTLIEARKPVSGCTRKCGVPISPGYCGADIKSVCAEAALCALRRRYPQIYTTTEKLLLDVSSIKITARDFVIAMEKIVPASQRAVISPGQALSSVIQPLLKNTFQRIMEALKRVFPHADGIKFQESGLESSSPLDEYILHSDEEGPPVFENGPLLKNPGKKNETPTFLHFTTSAYHQPTSYRPRLLLAGKPGLGQGSHLAPAVIHALEKFTVYTLDLAVLFGVSVTSPEETCAQ